MPRRTTPYLEDVTAGGCTATDIDKSRSGPKANPSHERRGWFRNRGFSSSVRTLLDRLTLGFVGIPADTVRRKSSAIQVITFTGATKESIQFGCVTGLSPRGTTVGSRDLIQLGIELILDKRRVIKCCKGKQVGVAFYSSEDVK